MRTNGFGFSRVANIPVSAPMWDQPAVVCKTGSAYEFSLIL